MDFSELVKEIRQKCYLSQQDFADAIGVSFSTVNRWETGKSIPNYQTMKRLVSYCNTSGIECENLDMIWKGMKK